MKPTQPTDTTADELTRAMTSVCSSLHITTTAETVHAYLHDVEGSWKERVIRAARRLELIATEIEGTGSQVPRPAVSVGEDGTITVLLADEPARSEDRRVWLTFTRASPLRELMGAKTAAQRVWSLMSLERDDLSVVLVYAIGIGVLSLATPIAVQTLVGTVAFGTVLQPIVVLAVLLLGALGFSAVLSALQMHVIEVLQRKLFARAALDLAFRIPRATERVAGVNRFLDVVTLQKSASILLADGSAVFLQVGIGLLVLAFYHPALLALDVVLILATVGLVVVPWRRGVETAIKESKAKYAVADWFEAAAHLSTAHHGLGAARQVQLRTESLVGEWLYARRKHFGIVFGQFGAALVMHVVGSAVLLGVGGMLVVDQQLTLGQLVAAELIVTAITAGVAKVGKLLDATYDLLAAADKLGALAEVPLDDGGPEPVPGKEALAVQLRDMAEVGTLTIPSRARFAIAGTLRDELPACLAGVTAPTVGELSFSGVDGRELARLELQSATTLVRGDALFEGTVLENIVAGHTDVTPAKAREALQRLGPIGRALALDGAVDGLNASERLVVVVARAIAKTPRLMVVDVSLERLPPATRRAVIEALVAENAPWTLVAFVGDVRSDLARACTSHHTVEHAEVA